MRPDKKSLVIYGCGGHARSLADVALGNGVEHLIFVDENAQPNEKQFGFDVVKTTSLEENMDCIPAAGDNEQRAGLFELLQNNNIITLISDNAYIGRNTRIAKGAFIANGAHIGPNTTIGVNTIINTHCVIEHDCVIGNHSHISVNAVVAGKSEVGDFVMIGTNASVIDNIKICSHVIIGAGAVVVQDITEPGTYVGMPARKI